VDMGNVAVAPVAAAAAEAAGVRYDAETENAAGSSDVVAAAARVRPPRPADWGTMTRGQRQRWKQQGGGHV